MRGPHHAPVMKAPGAASSGTAGGSGGNGVRMVAPASMASPPGRPPPRRPPGRHAPSQERRRGGRRAARPAVVPARAGVVRSSRRRVSRGGQAPGWAGLSPDPRPDPEGRHDNGQLPRLRPGLDPRAAILSWTAARPAPAALEPRSRSALSRPDALPARGAAGRRHGFRDEAGLRAWDARLGLAAGENASIMGDMDHHAPLDTSWRQAPAARGRAPRRACPRGAVPTRRGRPRRARAPVASPAGAAVGPRAAQGRAARVAPGGGATGSLA